MAIFMKFEGVSGEASLAGAPGYIKLKSFSWGTSRAVGTMRATGQTSTEPHVQDVQVVKDTDGASVRLTHEAVLGSLDRIVEIVFVRTGPAGPQTYLVYKLKGCGISAYNVAAGESDQPTESLSLNFNEIEMTYTTFGDELSGVPDSMFYELASASGG